MPESLLQIDRPRTQPYPIAMRLTCTAVTALLALAMPSAHAEDKPAKKAKDPDPNAYAKNLAAEASTCASICLDESDLLLFGGMITVPFERPSVEQCGVWMSSTAAERAQEAAARRKEADAEAVRLRYSAREKEELRKRAVAPIKTCEAEFRKRCEQARAGVAIDVRKKAVQDTEKNIEGIRDEKQREAVKQYFKNVLAACPLES